jgi:hypothetical protein
MSCRARVARHTNYGPGESKYNGVSDKPASFAPINPLGLRHTALGNINDIAMFVVFVRTESFRIAVNDLGSRVPQLAKHRTSEAAPERASSQPHSAQSAPHRSRRGVPLNLSQAKCAKQRACEMDGAEALVASAVQSFGIFNMPIYLLEDNICADKRLPILQEF